MFLSAPSQIARTQRSAMEHAFLDLRPDLTSLQRLAGVGKVEMRQLSESKALEMSVAAAVSSSRVCRE